VKLPLDGIFVLDFSTLLPGPLASLIMAEAGAEVLKVERPGRGDEMRAYEPRIGDDSANFVLLNRGKGSIAIDLKSPGALDALSPYMARADVLIEQFRPGVMDRLGLGFAALQKINPKIIYCSITGWGQNGPLANVAGHDLNYMAEVGLLDLVRDGNGAPALPPVLAADIAGGAYPAVMNILLALRQADVTGVGAHLDISMAENLFVFHYWGLANHGADSRWPKPAGELITGGTPRYQIYRTADDRFVAAAPLEDRFWDAFCDLLQVPASLRGPDASAAAVTAFLADRFRARNSGHWRKQFAGRDICCNVVATLQEALANPHFRERGVFSKTVASDARAIPALPVPVVSQWRSAAISRDAPSLGKPDDVSQIQAD
jgi:crotonobetainyl-CoA:carnitine CoA-transferase CaiB-like acyl-CoA transferase